MTFVFNTEIPREIEKDNLDEKFTSVKTFEQVAPSTYLAYKLSYDMLPKTLI
jgi:hypothetical protein